MRVLISVSDKTNIIQFAKTLEEGGADIISTGGTAKTLKEAGVNVTLVSDITNFPEMMDGRVKTLHPNIHGAILGKRDNKNHVKDAKVHEITWIDMVVVNLYPFKKTIEKEGVTRDEAIENIDIGGPSMIRSAAKNHESVTVVVNPERYEEIAEQWCKNKSISCETRQQLAYEAFLHTAQYDDMIAAYLAPDQSNFPDQLQLSLIKKDDLRYGENPHQAAAFYQFSSKNGITGYKQHHGKALSYNNIIDFEAAYQLVKEFKAPAAVVVKHTNPCGVAIGKELKEAYQKAYDSDPISAFGSIVGLNRPVDEQTATLLATHFVEVVIAPAFSKEALEILSKKPSIRIIELNMDQKGKNIAYRFVQGGLLAQTDDNQAKKEVFEVVSETPLPENHKEDLIIANIIVKHVKSNAIVIVKDGQLVGTGAGQMSRVKSVEIALEQAGELAQGAVLASDAFFPFKDSIQLAAKEKVAAIIQPGGSKRDQESIDEVNKNKIAMVFTGKRHFKH